MGSRVDSKLKVSWDKEGDILTIDTVWPHPAGLEADSVDSNVIVFLNVETGAPERLEIFGFSTLFKRLGDSIDLPIAAEILFDAAAQEAHEGSAA